MQSRKTKKRKKRPTLEKKRCRSGGEGKKGKGGEDIYRVA
jgi:hypothetical protein